MKRLKLTCLIVCIFFGKALFAQSERPSVVFQSGFRSDAQCSFQFSAGNKYLFGYNIIGEYIIWDMQSGRQIKKFAPPLSSKFSLLYTINPEISKDERYILIPDYPQGNYLLYDIRGDSIQYTFIPPLSKDGEKYTHARFSEDGSQIVLLSQDDGKKTDCVIRVFSRQGVLKKVCYMTIPRVFENSLLVKLIFNKAYQTIGQTQVLQSFVASPDLGQVYFTSLTGKLYKLDLTSRGFNTNVDETELTTLPNFSRHARYVSFGIYNNKLIVEKAPNYEQLKNNKGILQIDTIFVFNQQTLQLENTRVAKFIFVTDEHSNSVATTPLMMNTSHSLYTDYKDSSDGKQYILFRDIESGKEVFNYVRGEPFFWYTKGDYKANEISGYMVAMSDDHKLLASCSRDIIVYDTEKRIIKSYFSPVKGNIKLNQPLFLDSSRVLIPKIYNDAFILDLKRASVDRLKQEIDCQDTVRYGANTHFDVDNTAIVGLQNAAYSANENKIAITNNIPSDLCRIGDNKTIEVFTADKYQKLKEYSFYDREYTYHLNMIPGRDNLFLVNYKLIEFNDQSKPQIKELKIIQKKDTFYAVNPVYLPSKKSIFAILGTRSKPGNPDLYFAYFNIDGTLSNSVRFHREKTKLDFQTVIVESQLSPDSNRLLFALYDGTAGLFNIDSMKMINTVEHGEGYTIGKTFFHTYVMAGICLDNNQFFTVGNDAIINLWKVNEKKALRSFVLPDNSFLYGLTLSPDRKYLCGTGADKNIIFINIETGKVDLTFTAFDYDRYALVASNGYYVSNKKSNPELSFRFRGRYFEFSQFDLALNRPDKLLEQMGYASQDVIKFYRKAYNKRIEKLGYSPLSLDRLENYAPPEITLLNFLGEANTIENSINFSVAIKSGYDQAERLLISVNGVPLYGSFGKLLKYQASAKIEIPVTVALAYGLNRIVVSVVSKKGVESLREYISINRKVQVPIKPNLYLVSIGSGVFLNKEKNLKYAAKDASDVLNLFDQKTSSYTKIYKKLLVNENVTKKEVMKLKDQLKTTSPDDLVILYYAGHGVLDENSNYYVSTYNTDFTKPSLQSILYEDLESILDSIPARNKVLLIDACHSGEVDKENLLDQPMKLQVTGEVATRNFTGRSFKEKSIGLENSFELMQSLFSDLRRSSGSTVIASAGGAEYAIEGERWKNGVFTYCLQQGLKEMKADLNKDGLIQLSELRDYLKVEVSKLTNGKQRPTNRTENLVNDITIW